MTLRRTINRLFRRWKDYDPSWLVELAEASPEVLEDYPWLPEALSRCVRCKRESRAMIHFVSPERANQPGSEWQFHTNVILEHPTEGELILDLLKGHRVGGVEFYDRI